MTTDLSPSQRAARVRFAVFDVDGVLTDGRLHYGANGELFKSFDVRDGHGIKLLQRADIEVALLTARESAIVAQRAAELGIARVLQGRSDKAAAFAGLCQDARIHADHCAYMGDDWPDLPVLRAVGFAATPADACAEVQAAAHWIAPRGGGHGAVRDLAEFILRAQDKFDAMLARHLQAGAHA